METATISLRGCSPDHWEHARLRAKITRLQVETSRLETKISTVEVSTCRREVLRGLFWAFLPCFGVKMDWWRRATAGTGRRGAEQTQIPHWIPAGRTIYWAP
jgi:hypothetical protein